CKNVLQDIDLHVAQINTVILVGGSTRIPIVFDRVAQFFKKIPLNSINPDQVVAIGAAIQANMLFGHSVTNKTILLDVIPISLGIEVIGGLFEK
ncbi:Hsp70 family protein, partial [Buchnera aphidicola]|nr:Hsp70 family protein [Buchnera aphidicola]